MKLNTVVTFATPDLACFSHELADRLGVTHKSLKRDIRAMMDELGYCTCEQGYTFHDSKGREKYGYMLDKELLLCLITGFNVDRIVSELMQPVVWEDVA